MLKRAERYTKFGLGAWRGGEFSAFIERHFPSEKGSKKAIGGEVPAQITGASPCGRGVWLADGGADWFGHREALR